MSLDVAALATTGLRYGFAGLGTQPPGMSVHARVAVRSASGQPVTADAARLSVLARCAGQTWAVTGTDAVVGGRTLTTDDDGSVTVPLDGAALAIGVERDPQLSLPEGQYAVVVEVLAGECRSPRRCARWASVSSSVWLVRGCETSCAGADI